MGDENRMEARVKREQARAGEVISLACHRYFGMEFEYQQQNKTRGRNGVKVLKN